MISSQQELQLLQKEQLIKKLKKNQLYLLEQQKKKCMSLKNSKIYHTEITSTEWKEEGPLEEDKNARFSGSSSAKASASAHCVVKGKIEKRKSADGKDYSIGFELRLPEKWTEEYIALDYIVGKAGKEYPDPNKEQPLCPYPKVATYIGGDKNKASSFECK